MPDLEKDAAHYLFGVMRLQVGAVISVFNGKDGEWDAQVTQAGKKSGILTCIRQTAALRMPPDVWLCFAPIKKERTDFIVEKATEMGAAQIIPVKTDFTNTGRINLERLQAHAIEAAEQCNGTYVPPVSDMQNLDVLLANWPRDRHLMFCDEAMTGDPVNGLQDAPTGPWGILIGPEGGFSDAERATLRNLPFVRTVSLGPRILRADTAAVAALTLWQHALGDWSA